MKETLFTDLYNSYVCFSRAIQLQFHKAFLKPVPDNGFVKQITKKRKQKPQFYRQNNSETAHCCVGGMQVCITDIPDEHFALGSSQNSKFWKTCFLKHHLSIRGR